MKNPPFIMLPHAVYDSPEFATLSAIDISVLLLLIYKHRHRPSNNGAIPLGTREAALRCRCNQSTALRALAHLQTARLISRTKKGHLTEFGRPDVASRWFLNFFPAPEKAASSEPKG